MVFLSSLTPPSILGREEGWDTWVYWRNEGFYGARVTYSEAYRVVW